MGKQANVLRDRICLSCEQVLYTSSGGLKKHFITCVRMKRLGLELPTIQRPKAKLVRV